MKKFLIAVTFLALIVGGLSPKVALAYSFGDYRSSTLATKAWDALKAEDLQAVLAYTNKCLELYTAQAKKMQTELKDYPQGKSEDIFKFWAVNDVATCLFIQGEAYRQAGMKDEAVVVFEKIINEYTFGQTYDVVNKTFWKPAEAAKEKIAIIKSGSNVDFGDYTSTFLVAQAWKSLAEGDTKSVVIYADKVIELYQDKAKVMQQSLTEFPMTEPKEKVFAFWALNDVGTAYFVKGEAYKKDGDANEAKKSYRALVDEYFYAQCWDPNGWFWKPAEAAQQALDEVTGPETESIVEEKTEVNSEVKESKTEEAPAETKAKR